MIIIVRDEDTPTVAEAVEAFAREEGLEPIDVEEQTAQNPLAMIGVLTGPRATIAAGGEDGDQIVVQGLEWLDVAEADEWAVALSKACNTEAIAIEAADDGLRVWVATDGDLDSEEPIEVPLGSSGRVQSERLAELAGSEEGANELTTGIAATSAEELLDNVLRCLGVANLDHQNSMMLAFHDPLDDGDGAEDGEGPRFVVEAVGGGIEMAALTGKVGGRVAALQGSVFSVSVLGAIEGGGGVEGIHLALSGDGLALFAIDRIDVDMRVRGAFEPTRRTVDPEIVTSSDGSFHLSIDLDDAYLESASRARPKVEAGADLFASMQQLVSASSDQMLNTITLYIMGTGRKVGSGSLVLTAMSLSNAATSGQIATTVRVTK